MMPNWCILAPPYVLYTMPRQSITLTSPNDQWLNAQVASEEYSSKSELVNDLIRKARADDEHLAYVRARLKEAENSGFTSMNMEEIRKEVRSEIGLK